MPRATSEWLRAYEAKGFHPEAIKQIDLAAQDQAESLLHDEIIVYLNAKDIPYYHSRMDVACTGNIGAPDFFVFLDGGRTAHIECKRKTGKVKPKQLEYHAWLSKKGHKVYVVRNFYEFREAIAQAAEASLGICRIP